MKVTVAAQSDGNLQFIIEAENHSDRVVLGCFECQTKGKALTLHAFHKANDGKEQLGPLSCRFGTGRQEEKVSINQLI